MRERKQKEREREREREREVGVGGGNIGTRRGLLLWKSQRIQMVIHFIVKPSRKISSIID